MRRRGGRRQAGASRQDPACASGAINLAILLQNTLPGLAHVLTSTPLHGLAVVVAFRHLLPTPVSASLLLRSPLLRTLPQHLLLTAVSTMRLLRAPLVRTHPRWSTVLLGKQKSPTGVVAPPQQSLPLPRTSPPVSYTHLTLPTIYSV